MLTRNSVIFISVFVISALLFSLSTASAFPDLASNETNSTSISKTAVSSYGPNVVIIQHLIEIDQVTYPGYFKIIETIIYKNLGTENYSGSIYTYVQDGAFNIGVSKQEMAQNVSKNTFEAFQVSENVIGWNDIMSSGTGMLPMYQIEYMVPAEPTGKTDGPVTFTKKLKHSTHVNYIYMPITGMSTLVVKLKKSEGMKTTVLDNDGAKIQADYFEETGNLETYNWFQPMFVEITFKLSSSTPSGSDITMYLIILLIIIALIVYQVLRKKNPAIKGLEDKMGSVLPKKHDEELDDKLDEELYIKEEDEAKEEKSRQPPIELNDIEALGPDELRTIKHAISNVLLKLDEDYVNGIISEDEYNDIRNNYEGKVKSIMIRIKTLEKKD